MKIIQSVLFIIFFMVMAGCNNNQPNIVVPVESKSPDAMKARERVKAIFIKKLAEKRRSDWEYADYASKIENYTVIVYEEGSSYRVIFTIKKLVTQNLMGEDIYMWLTKKLCKF